MKLVNLIPLSSNFTDIKVLTKKEMNEELDDMDVSLPVQLERYLDKVIGILNIKTLMPHLNEPEDYNWRNLILAPYFIPENKPMDDTLAEMRLKHSHFAIVVDEIPHQLFDLLVDFSQHIIPYSLTMNAGPP